MPVRTRAPAEDRESGFTLIELLVVIIIIGILAAIAIPVFLNQRVKGYEARAKADVRNVATAEETYLDDHPNGFAACDSSPGATGCVSMLSNEVWKASSGTSTAVGVDAGNGFCAVSKAASGSYFVFDSEAGGLQGTKDSSFAGITWPSGTCAVAAHRPASF